MRELDVIENVLCSSSDPRKAAGQEKDEPAEIHGPNDNYLYRVMPQMSLEKPTVRTIRTLAPLSPTVSKNIWVTGCPVGEANVVPKSWIEKSRPRIRNQPSTAETPRDMMIPILPDIAALRVSSVIYKHKFGE